MQRNLAATVTLLPLQWLALSFAIFFTVPAWAGDPAIERQVQLLQKRAIEEDSLNVNYVGAINKLQAAIGKCAAGKCAAALKGTLLRDLGAMQVLNGSIDEGRASFAQALAIEGSLELDPAYKTPTLQGLWFEAKKKSGGGSEAGVSPSTLPSGGPGEGAGASGGQPSAGDFAHQPAGGQLVRTPLPIYAEYLGADKLQRVVVKYKGAGMADWKPLELRKMDTGYGGLIPCKDVTQGAMQYYLQGFNDANDAIAASGTRTKPYSVVIGQKLSGAPPTLPGQEPPQQCGDLSQAECPPDFPGCNNPKKSVGDDCDRGKECQSNACVGGKCTDTKGAGETCEKDDDCGSASCVDDKCAAAKKGESDDCERDDECASGACKTGKCAPVEPGDSKQKARNVWIGVAAALDFLSMPSAIEVCRLNAAGTAPVNGQGYNCVDPNTGANFPNPKDSKQNDSIQTKQGDTVQPGLTRGNLRLMLSVDYALNANILLGLRGGYVFFTNPASTPGPAFAPLHVEARFTYLIGHDAIEHVAPFAFLGAGVGEFDAYVPTTVGIIPQGGGVPVARSENAWLVAGPAFAALGGGVRLPLGKTAAATVAGKVEGAFGGTAGFLWGLAPELGVQLGF